MRNLEVYKRHFDQEYRAYSDAKYLEIAALISALPSVEDASETFNSDEAGKVLSLVAPLIEIKNYKSQTPFPVSLFDAAKIIIEIKNTAASENISSAHVKLIGGLLGVKGFRLPTVSAVLHFCHPNEYPIVDRNIKAACALLHEEFPGELSEYPPPTLPTTMKPLNNIAKYKAFIGFLTKVKQLHNEQYQTNYGFRDLDKALMVYGVPERKVRAEATLVN